MLDSSTSVMCVILLFGEKSRFIGFEKSHTCAAYFSTSTYFCAVGGVAKYCQIPPSFVTVHPLPLLVGYDNLAGGSYWCLVITFWETEL